MSYAPEITPWAAKLIACWLLPHWRSTVVPGTDSGKPGAEQRIAGDVDGLVADLGDGAGDHVVDLRGVDARAGHQFGQAVREQVDRQHVVQCAAGLALSDRGAYRPDDDRVAACISGHLCLL